MYSDYGLQATLEFYSKNPQETEFFGRVINKRAHQRLAQLVQENKPYIRFGGKLDESDKVINLFPLGGECFFPSQTTFVRKCHYSLMFFSLIMQFVSPTLMDFGTDEAAFAKSSVMADEIFGPILPSLRYRDLDQGMIEPNIVYFTYIERDCVLSVNAKMPEDWQWRRLSLIFTPHCSHQLHQRPRQAPRPVLLHD